MVLHPADDYVAEFARNAPRDRIISAKTIMVPTKSRAKKIKNGVNGKAKIGEIAAQVLNADKPIIVTDDDGAPIGEITRKLITEALFGTDQQ